MLNDREITVRMTLERCAIPIKEIATGCWTEEEFFAKYHLTRANGKVAIDYHKLTESIPPSTTPGGIKQPDGYSIHSESTPILPDGSGEPVEPGPPEDAPPGPPSGGAPGPVPPVNVPSPSEPTPPPAEPEPTPPPAEPEPTPPPAEPQPTPPPAEP